MTLEYSLLYALLGGLLVGSGATYCCCSTARSLVSVASPVTCLPEREAKAPGGRIPGWPGRASAGVRLARIEFAGGLAWLARVGLAGRIRHPDRIGLHQRARRLWTLESVATLAGRYLDVHGDRGAHRIRRTSLVGTMKTLTALLAGLLFGGGLLVSGMTNPAVVLGFLDVSGQWNPALAFVMAGAIAVAAPAFYFVRRHQRNWRGEPTSLPGRTTDRCAARAGQYDFRRRLGIERHLPRPRTHPAHGRDGAGAGLRGCDGRRHGRSPHGARVLDRADDRRYRGGGNDVNRR